jgi:hypothetical protein
MLNSHVIHQYAAYNCGGYFSSTKGSLSSSVGVVWPKTSCVTHGHNYAAVSLTGPNAFPWLPLSLPSAADSLILAFFFTTPVGRAVLNHSCPTSRIYRPRLSPIYYQHNISPCLTITKHSLVTISTFTDSQRDRSLDLKRHLATSEVSGPERHPFAPIWYSRPLPHNATSKQREKSAASYE